METVLRHVEPTRSRDVPAADAASSLSQTDGPDYFVRNRAAWEKWAPGYAADGHRGWEDEELRWGIWRAPESRFRLLDGFEHGAHVVELGCGTAAIPAALARRGFRPVGVDIARQLLDAAAELQREFGLSFPLLRANAERLHYDDATFDCVISDYGASLWCNPYRWIPEAHRLLRPGGRLIFITNSALLVTCTPQAGGPIGEQLVRDYFALGRVEFPGDGAVEFHLTHGDWVRLLHATGLDLGKPDRDTASAGVTPRFDFVSAEWARRWPSEEIWIAGNPPDRRAPSEAQRPPGVTQQADVKLDRTRCDDPLGAASRYVQ